MNKVVELRRGEIFDEQLSMHSSLTYLNPADDRVHTNSSMGFGGPADHHRTTSSKKSNKVR
jgi:hypothetical protein